MKKESTVSTIDTLIASYEFNRGRTLALLDEIEQEANPQAVLGWRPGSQRAHIAWQFMHIGVTEEIFAAERLAEKPSKHNALWPRFRGGSTPDEDIPQAATIRQVLDDGRKALLTTLGEMSDDQLQTVPPALAEKKWRLIDVLHIISWHEGHHQGQAHLSLNLYRAQQK